jgi:tetratricopeptide (TPR) repeat protein
MTKNVSIRCIDQAGKKYRSGQLRRSGQMYAQAAGNLLESGDALMAAEMANNRSVALLQAATIRARCKAARIQIRSLPRQAIYAGRAVALGNQAAALEALNRTDEALKKYWQCSDLLKQTGEKDTVRMCSRAYLRCRYAPVTSWKRWPRWKPPWIIRRS